MQKQSCGKFRNSLSFLLVFLIVLTACSANRVIDYSGLRFAAGQELVYPKDATREQENSLPPFSEKDIIQGSDYIIEGHVVKSEFVNVSPDSSWAAYNVLYTIEPTTLFYAKDHALSEQRPIQLETPLPDRLQSEALESSENVAFVSSPTAEMLQNRDYIMCLKSSEKGFRLVFPGYRPIEKTADGHYVFYQGWKSLRKNASDVTIDEVMSEYKYRNDESFLADFEALVQKYK